MEMLYTTQLPTPGGASTAGAAAIAATTASTVHTDTPR